jgi:hypothetical protein
MGLSAGFNLFNGGSTYYAVDAAQANLESLNQQEIETRASVRVALLRAYARAKNAVSRVSVADAQENGSNIPSASQEASNMATIHVTTLDVVARTRLPNVAFRVSFDPPGPDIGPSSAVYNSGSTATQDISVPGDTPLHFEGIACRLAKQSSAVSIKPQQSRNIQLLVIGTTHSFYARVVDASTLTVPRSNATCILFGNGDTELDRLVVSSSGLICAPWNAKCIFYISVAFEGYEPVLCRVAEDHDEPAKALVVPVRPSSTLTGRIVDSAGSPLPYHSISATVPRSSLVRPHNWGARILGYHSTTANSDANGSYLLNDLPNYKNIQLAVVSRDGIKKTQQTIKPLYPGERRFYDVVVTSAVSVRGLIEDSRGRAVKNAQCDCTLVGAGGESANRKLSTDSSGSFSAALLPGSWQLRCPVRAGRKALTWGKGSISVSTQDNQTVHIRLQEEGDIKGLVTDSDGRRAKDVWIRATTNGYGAAMTSCDDNGEFSIGPLDRDNIYDLEVFGAEGWKSIGARKAGADPIHLYLDSTVECICGQLRVGNLAEIAKDAVVLASEQHGKVLKQARIDDEGAFIIEGLPKGSYNIVARTTRGDIGVISAVRTTAKCESSVEVSLRLGAALRVTYLGALQDAIIYAYAQDILVDRAELNPGEQCVLCVPATQIRLELGTISQRGWTGVVNAEGSEAVDVVVE